MANEDKKDFNAMLHDNKEFLTGLFHAMYDELPTPKPKKKK